ncbi:MULTISPECIES: DNA cytosine methyltransferase [Hyphobacterium]|uniref:DNA (cytosine-5-)-methyltransferase n=1 Tax=Hyphobacterium vulgare TaxID=1736751 RepID=A0ABV6ZUF3_9PROT
MPRRRKFLVADLLCGAGGSSTGAQRALAELGLEMELVCVNHWGVAIETHKKNHPEARHYCEDIAAVRPHLIVPEGRLDLLMASPSCTHHSVARGGKPTSDQQRSDPWHIITWLVELNVKRIIIENVWEFTSWGPVDGRTGKPIKSRKGEYFNLWIDTIRRLGYTPEYRKLNAADYGDATTRKRFILMARKDRKAVSWPVPTHQKRAEGNLDLFPGVKPWRPAREIIDWSQRGKSIFDRKKPLAPKTLARIHAGAMKFGWPEPFLVVLRNHMAAQGLDVPLPALTAGGQHVGLAEPVVLSQHSSGAPRGTHDPLPTITTGGAAAEKRVGCARPMLVEPFVLSQASGGAPRSVGDPIPTQTTGGAGGSHALIAPYYGSGSGETCKSADVPLDTITSKERHSLIVPVTHSQAMNGARNVADPIPTVTTAKGGEFAVVMPVTHAGGHDRVQDPSTDPLPTVTGANRGELAFIAAQFGERDGQAPRVHDIENPTPTIAATGHVNLVEGVEQGERQYDILFRMLEPHELAAAMGFTSDEYAYEFAGTKTEKVKQIGNAVSVAKMKACVGALCADAAPKEAAKPAAKRKAA